MFLSFVCVLTLDSLHLFYLVVVRTTNRKELIYSINYINIILIYGFSLTVITRICFECPLWSVAFLS